MYFQLEVDYYSNEANKNKYKSVQLIAFSIENFSFEINLKKRKWFLNCSYNPHKNQISNHLECLNRLINECNTYY